MVKINYYQKILKAMNMIKKVEKYSNYMLKRVIKANYRKIRHNGYIMIKIYYQ